MVPHERIEIRPDVMFGKPVIRRDAHPRRADPAQAGSPREAGRHPASASSPHARGHLRCPGLCRRCARRR